MRCRQVSESGAGQAANDGFGQRGRRGFVAGAGNHQRRAADAGVAASEIHASHGSATGDVGSSGHFFEALAQVRHQRGAATGRISAELRREPALNRCGSNRDYALRLDGGHARMPHSADCIDVIVGGVGDGDAFDQLRIARSQ